MVFSVSADPPAEKIFLNIGTRVSSAKPVDNVDFPHPGPPTRTAVFITPYKNYSLLISSVSLRILL